MRTLNAIEPQDPQGKIIRYIRELIAVNTSEAPNEPGVYRLPCGNCYVDFFISPEGEEHWMVPGDDRPYTRDTVSIARHGEYPWARLRTLAKSARVIEQLLETGISLPELIIQLENEERPRSPLLHETKYEGGQTPPPKRDPYRLALTEILLTRGIDRHESNEDEIRIELQRAGIESPTDSDVQRVVDALAAGDREKTLEAKRDGTRNG